jgi:catechol 2,3-dioxygenase-like lactoylglutathione lyase family enzyme
MPRVDGVLETALYVADLDRSAAFYRDVFGFEVVDSGERLVALCVAPRQMLLLFRKGASSRPPLVLPPHDGDGELHLTFAVPAGEIGRWADWLRERGIPIEQDKTWGRGGRSLYFRDPDRHLLEVASPGVWSVY